MLLGSRHFCALVSWGIERGCFLVPATYVRGHSLHCCAPLIRPCMRRACDVPRPGGNYCSLVRHWSTCYDIRYTITSMSYNQRPVWQAIRRHAHTHTHRHTRTHARTHTHTHTPPTCTSRSYHCCAHNRADLHVRARHFRTAHVLTLVPCQLCAAMHRSFGVRLPDRWTCV